MFDLVSSTTFNIFIKISRAYRVLDPSTIILKNSRIHYARKISIFYHLLKLFKHVDFVSTEAYGVFFMKDLLGLSTSSVPKRLFLKDLSRKITIKKSLRNIDLVEFLMEVDGQEDHKLVRTEMKYWRKKNLNVIQSISLRKRL